MKDLCLAEFNELSCLDFNFSLHVLVDNLLRTNVFVKESMLCTWSRMKSLGTILWLAMFAYKVETQKTHHNNGIKTNVRWKIQPCKVWFVVQLLEPWYMLQCKQLWEIQPCNVWFIAQDLFCKSSYETIVYEAYMTKCRMKTL